MKRFITKVILLLATTMCSEADVVELSGEEVLPRGPSKAAGSYQLKDDFRFHLHGQTKIEGDFDVNGKFFDIDTGGGNPAIMTGTLSGDGKIKFNGAGAPHLQQWQSKLTGLNANTFSGSFNLWRGSLLLDKPVGVTAINGDLVIGGGGNQAIIWLGADGGIDDAGRS